MCCWRRLKKIKVNIKQECWITRPRIMINLVYCECLKSGLVGQPKQVRFTDNPDFERRPKSGCPIVWNPEAKIALSLVWTVFNIRKNLYTYETVWDKPVWISNFGQFQFSSIRISNVHCILVFKSLLGWISWRLKIWRDAFFAPFCTFLSLKLGIKHKWSFAQFETFMKSGPDYLHLSNDKTLVFSTTSWKLSLH